MLKRFLLGGVALVLAGCGTGVGSLSGVPMGTAGIEASRHAWNERDVEFLARILAAEARGELKTYPASVAGVAYVMMRTARKYGVSIEALVTQKQPWLLTSYKEGPRGVNGKYFYSLSKKQIENYGQFEAIARRALKSYDPTGIDANHFYDDSISAPSWAKGPGVKRKQIGNFIFVHNPKDA